MRISLVTIACLPLMATAWLAGPSIAASRTLAPRVQPRFAAQNDDELTKAITDLLGPFEGKKPKDAPAEPAPAPAPAAAPAEDSD